MVLSSLWRHDDEAHERSKENFLRSMTVRHDKDISASAVQDICASVGWGRREPELIAKALLHSLAVISIWDNTLIVGFARATGDHVFNATIWDMAVRPCYQHKGVGRLLMRELIKDLDQYNITLITLFADPGIDGFYKKFGFSTDPFGVQGMYYEKKS